MKAPAFLGLFLIFMVLIDPAGTARSEGPAGESRGTQAALGAAIAYQGFLRQAGTPVTGSQDFRFILYDSEVGGSQVGSTIERTGVGVTGGLFTVALDFGEGAFDGQSRWLDIAVRPGGSVDFTPLAPRQALSPAPQALYATSAGSTNSALNAATAASASAAPWSGLTGTPAGFADGVDNDSGGTITGVTPGTGLSGGGTSGAVSLSVTGAPWPGLTGVPAGFADGVDDIGWSLSGNAGTSGAFLGTTDAVPFELRVGGARVLRLEPNDFATPNFIAGVGNQASPGVIGATIGGGGGVGSIAVHTNVLSDYWGTIAGGDRNRAGDEAGTVDDANFATVGGGQLNNAFKVHSTVSGGKSNTASGAAGTVGGGNTNTASGSDSTVGGGINNAANGPRSAVGGGNTNAANGENSVVGGGVTNNAGFLNSTVSGGIGNGANNEGSTVAGGGPNTASGFFSAVSGGGLNTASGRTAIVAGGELNTAGGDWSFASGRRAKIAGAHSGSFVFADSTDADFSSTAANRFAVRASGGATFVNSAGIGVNMVAGGNSFAATSDRNVKANFVPVDGLEALAKVSSLPLSTWNLVSQDPSIRHIGPMAQDFYAAFGVGEDDLHISTVDADGVALAAIQGLDQLLQENQVEIAGLKARNTELEAHNTALESRLAAVEARLLAGGVP